MKYIISESRFNKIVSDYLDSIDYTEYIDSSDIFLANPETEHGEYSYDKNEQDLLINPDIVNMLSKVFGMDNYETFHTLENWFSKKYDVHIESSRPWDW